MQTTQFPKEQPSAAMDVILVICHLTDFTTHLHIKISGNQL